MYSAHVAFNGSYNQYTLMMMMMMITRRILHSQDCKNHAGETQRSAASVRGDVTQRKPGVARIDFFAAGITAGKTQRGTHAASVILRSV